MATKNATPLTRSAKLALKVAELNVENEQLARENERLTKELAETSGHKAQIERELAKRDKAIDRLHSEHHRAIQAHRDVIDLLLSRYALNDTRVRTLSFDAASLGRGNRWENVVEHVKDVRLTFKHDDSAVAVPKEQP